MHPSDKPQNVKIRLRFRDKLAYLVYCLNFATGARQRERDPLEICRHRLGRRTRTGRDEKLEERIQASQDQKVASYSTYSKLPTSHRSWWVFIFRSPRQCQTLESTISPLSRPWIWLSAPSLLQIHPRPPASGQLEQETESTNCWVMRNIGVRGTSDQ